MLSVVCWLWRQAGCRTAFGPERVNVLAAMVRRHYPAPHRFLCVCADPAGLDAGIEWVQDRADFAGLQSPHGPQWPSCYRRLRLFAPDAAATFGERIVSIDLASVLVGDMRPLWDRPEDFIGWQDPTRPKQLCGAMWMLRAGAYPEVWEQFDPQRSPAVAFTAGLGGSDQAWLSYCLPDVPRWTRADGVYSYRIDGCAAGLPADARVVMFHGKPKPFEAPANTVAWVRENYQ